MPDGLSYRAAFEPDDEGHAAAPLDAATLADPGGPRRSLEVRVARAERRALREAVERSAGGLTADDVVSTLLALLRELDLEWEAVASPEELRRRLAARLRVVEADARR